MTGGGSFLIRDTGTRRQSTEVLGGLVPELTSADGQ